MLLLSEDSQLQIVVAQLAVDDSRLQGAQLSVEPVIGGSIPECN